MFQSLYERPDRRSVWGLALLAALLFIALGTLLLSGTRMGRLVFDLGGNLLPYPFTIQNFTHIAFFLGLAEIFVRWRSAEHELTFFDQKLLPEDDETVLEKADLGPLRKNIVGLYDEERGFLPSMINLCILQFQSGRSVDQTVAVMQGSLDLLQHRVDLRYSLIRYLVWFIPTLGFLGTAMGIGATLAAVPADGNVQMPLLASQLSVAFDTTVMALIWSAILVFLFHFVQEREELGVNLVGTYTLRNLINRLYAG